MDSSELLSVTQLASALGISARTVRFYEDKGLIAPRRAGNNRVYSARDRARMTLILRGKRLGFSLREIKEYLDLYDLDPSREKQVRLLLQTVQSRISMLQEQRVALEQTLSELGHVQMQANEALANLEGGGLRPLSEEQQLETTGEAV